MTQMSGLYSLNGPPGSATIWAYGDKNGVDVYIHLPTLPEKNKHNGGIHFRLTNEQLEFLKNLGK